MSFLGPTTHRTRIAGSGADFIPLEGDADIDDLLYYSPDNPHPPVSDYHTLSWQDRAVVDLEKHHVDPIPTQWHTVKRALSRLHASHPHQPVIIINEAFFAGLLPYHLGAPLPEGVPPPLATLCLSVTPPAIRSADLPPFDFPLSFDPSPAGHARNSRAWDEWGAQTAGLRRRMEAALVEAGARRPLPGNAMLDGFNYVCHDAVLQIGVPGFEYPRGDWPTRFQFVGFLPLARPPVGGYPNLPGWWDEVTCASGKKVVVVAQGTVETNPYDLIIPTVEAMRGREDVLVAAIMGRKGAGLPEGFDVPGNVRVTDYLHYDAILPYASVWVHNGGYGAITHGVAHGVPMVVAGEGQDKPENIKRVRYSGIGVGLGRAKPSASDLKLSLEAVLEDERYKNRVGVLRQETIDLDCFGRIEKAVLDALK